MVYAIIVLKHFLSQSKMLLWLQTQLKIMKVVLLVQYKYLLHVALTLAKMTANWHISLLGWPGTEYFMIILYLGGGYSPV